MLQPRNIANLTTELEYPTANEEERQRSAIPTIQNFIKADHGLCRYRQLRERLVELDSQRQQRQRRLDQLRKLQRLLEPFAEPQQNIQPNLITRDGQLVQELEKMRMLVARVGGRIGQKKRPRGNSEAENASYPTGSDQKLEALLDMD